MRRKTGLLPKWLFLNAFIRILCVFLEYKARKLEFGTGHWIFIYFSLALACIRLFGVVKINLIFYVLVAFSYLLEILWLLAVWYSSRFSTVRFIAEVLIALFSLGWVVFLYPYYLLRTEDESNKEDCKDK